MPPLLKRALLPLFWRFPPLPCPECGADIEMAAPLRMSRGQIWYGHGRWHAKQLVADLIAQRTVID